VLDIKKEIGGPKWQRLYTPTDRPERHVLFVVLLDESISLRAHLTYLFLCYFKAKTAFFFFFFQKNGYIEVQESFALHAGAV
jgi:hypothetical protein